jgi:hypothetical protein
MNTNEIIKNEVSNELENNLLKLDIEELNIDELGSENENSIQLKNPNEVYYSIWKEARKKAKMARSNAIQAYLEAKNIKNTYMLNDMNDSDDEFDELINNGIQ